MTKEERLAKWQREDESEVRSTLGAVGDAVKIDFFALDAKKLDALCRLVLFCRQIGHVEHDYLLFALEWLARKRAGAIGK